MNTHGLEQQDSGSGPADCGRGTTGWSVRRPSARPGATELLSGSYEGRASDSAAESAHHYRAVCKALNSGASLSSLSGRNDVTQESDQHPGTRLRCRLARGIHAMPAQHGVTSARCSGTWRT
jgi:hypothetical protein